MLADFANPADEYVIKTAKFALFAKKYIIMSVR